MTSNGIANTPSRSHSAGRAGQNGPKQVSAVRDVDVAGWDFRGLRDGLEYKLGPVQARYLAACSVCVGGLS